MGPDQDNDTTGDPTIQSRLPRGVLLVAAAGLLVASIVGFVRDDTGPTEAAGPTPDGAVTILDFAFDPEQVTVAIGDPVTWTNEDEATHTVTSDGDGPLASGDLAQGATYEAAFEEPGTYAYVCTIHPTMEGTVEVTP